MKKHEYLGCFHAASTRENISWVWVIEIHDSQCNLRCKANNIVQVFPLGPDNILKMTSSQYSEITLAS